MTITNDKDVLAELGSWSGLRSFAFDNDPIRRVIAILFSTRLLESRLSTLGILGRGSDQVIGLSAAVRIAEGRYSIEHSTVASALRAIKDRNKVVHADVQIQKQFLPDDLLAHTTEDEEESTDPMEAIVDRAPQIVAQLNSLDIEIEYWVVTAVERKRTAKAARDKREREASAEEVLRIVGATVGKVVQSAKARVEGLLAGVIEAWKPLTDFAKKIAEPDTRRRQDQAMWTTTTSAGKSQARRELTAELHEINRRRARESSQRLLKVLLVLALVALVFGGYYCVDKGRDEASRVMASIRQKRAGGSYPEYSESLTKATLCALTRAKVDITSETLATTGEEYHGIASSFVRHFEVMELQKLMGDYLSVWVILTERIYPGGLDGAAAFSDVMYGKTLEELDQGEVDRLAKETAESSRTSRNNSDGSELARSMCR